MATASGASSVLQTTPENENFQRLTHLLIAGGTSVLREVFDFIHPPSRLPTELANPLVKARLKDAELSKPQWECLYPAPGRYGKSSDFDITLLSCLFRQLGWGKLPATVTKAATADLDLVRSYRNTVYAHARTMKINDDDFDDLWTDISGALVRLAKCISRAKRQEWSKAIGKLQHAPLTQEDEQNVNVLIEWSKRESETKEIVIREHQITRQAMEMVGKRVIGEIKGVL